MQLSLGDLVEVELPRLNAKQPGAMESLAEGQNQKCFRCGKTKPLSDFYKHPQMGNGHLGKCKECNKQDVRDNYRLRRDQYRRYYAERETTQRRKEHRHRRQKLRRQKHPEKYKANYLAGDAIRDGRLIRQPCEKCGNPKTEAHHDDYSKPLDVRWLCFKHHREHHGQTVG